MIPLVPGARISYKDSDGDCDVLGPHVSTTSILSTKHLETGLPWCPGLAHEPQIALIQEPGPKLSLRRPPFRLSRATLIWTQSPGKELFMTWQVSSLGREKGVSVEIGGHEVTLRGGKSTLWSEKAKQPVKLPQC